MAPDLGLDGLSVTINPGTLPFDLTLSISESDTLMSADAASAFDIPLLAEAGPGVILSNDENITDLAESFEPMQLQLPLFNAALNLIEDDTTLVVFYRKLDGLQGCTERIYPPSTFTIENNIISIDVRRFGAFQPLKVDTDSLKRKANADASSDGSFVVTRSECQVQSKDRVTKIRSVAKIESFEIERIGGATLRFHAKITLGGDEISECSLYASQGKGQQRQSFTEKLSVPEFTWNLGNLPDRTKGKLQAKFWQRAKSHGNIFRHIGGG
jgi:hypothetical protein